MTKKIIKILVIIFIIIFILLKILDYVLNQIYVPAPQPLKEHPCAYWLGGKDGGTFVEIFKNNHPDYYIAFYDRYGTLMSKGIYRFKEKTEQQLTHQIMLGYGLGDNGTGENVLLLKDDNYLYKVKK